MKKILIVTVIILVVIQFFRPSKNQSDNQNSKIEVSSEINQILTKSCFDCHSNSTIYPWYNEIAPVSWILANHIKEGKEHLNFSEWKNYNTNQKNHILDEIGEVLKKNEMPLKSYLLLHKEVKLTTIDVNILLNWLHEENSNSKEHE